MSHYNLYSVSRTLANRIWEGIKEDRHLRTIITNEGQIVHNLPRDAPSGTAQISVLLYNVAELAAMRNQPQPPQNSPKPRILHNIKLRYLITPLTFNPENDQVLLAKIMQLFGEKPVLRGQDLQWSLNEEAVELRVVLDDAGVDDLGQLWSALGSPYKLSLSYSVFPVPITESTSREKQIHAELTKTFLEAKTEQLKKVV